MERPRLKSFHVKHFKSLHDTGLDDVKPLTVIVGPNAVGKSNLVDAIRFLRDAANNGLDHAISERHGINVIRQYSPRRPYQLSLALTFEQYSRYPSRNRGAPYSFHARYEAVIASDKSGNFWVEREHAVWAAEKIVFSTENRIFCDGLDIHTFERDPTGAVVIDQKTQDFKIPKDQLGLPSPSMRFGIRASAAPTPIAQFLSGFRFSNPYPNVLREPSRPDTEKLLREDGSNWASVLKAMRQTKLGRDAYEQIIEMMKFVMPSLDDVTVKGVGGYLVPQFRVTDSGGAHLLDPVQLSDGTLRIFGLLLALYQSPAPDFIAIEEPEQTVHPGVVAMLADAFREVSKRTQLLITSHSPFLVDMFDVDSLRVASYSDGETRISKIRNAQRQSVKERLISVKELMASEGLQPQN